VNAPDEWLDGLLAALASVHEQVGTSPVPVTGESRFADVLDSMGMVEFLLTVAEQCGVTPADIEEAVAGRFGTVAELAAALQAARYHRRTGPITTGFEATTRPASAAGGVVGTACPDPRRDTSAAVSGLPALARKQADDAATPSRPAPLWLAATAVCLPDTMEPAAAIDAALGRPPGWLERHAGILERRIWAGQDPLAAAAAAGRDCLSRGGLGRQEVGALLVTSEAPPLPVGLAAALHHGLDLGPGTVALEVGGACTGFLAALWVAQRLHGSVGPVLVVALEAPSHYLQVQPGPAGEAAALFGDAAAACLLCETPLGPGSALLRDVVLGADGAARRLVRIGRAAGGVQLLLERRALAGRAVAAMAQSVRDLVTLHGMAVTDLAAVVAHGGNGRFPGLLAQRLGMAVDLVWSETSRTGNLGSASLPVAWAARAPAPRSAVAWTAVGAGLTWAAALTGGSPVGAADA
jgi:3-oxoacyl-[acyl-carrier-protein] synthase-3